MSEKYGHKRKSKERLSQSQRLRRLTAKIALGLAALGVAEAKFNIPYQQAELDKTMEEYVGDVPVGVEDAITAPAVHGEQLTGPKAKELEARYAETTRFIYLQKSGPRDTLWKDLTTGQTFEHVDSDELGLNPERWEIVAVPGTPEVSYINEIVKECEPYTVLVGTVQFASTDGLDTKRLIATGPDGKEFWKDIEEASTVMEMSNPKVSIEPDGIGFTAPSDKMGEVIKVVVSWPAMMEALIDSSGEVEPRNESDDSRPAFLSINGIRPNISATPPFLGHFRNYENTENYIGLSDLIPPVPGALKESDVTNEGIKYLKKLNLEAQKAVIEALKPFLYQVRQRIDLAQSVARLEPSQVLGQVVGEYSASDPQARRGDTARDGIIVVDRPMLRRLDYR